MFLDRINRDNPNPQLGEIESTNPCGEQPLLPYESCNLGSINLARMVRFTREGAEVDKEKLASIISTAVHMLDNVIDMNDYPIREIEDMSHATRRIGLGVMGFSDLLVQLGIPYNSDEALTVAEDVMSFIQRQTNEASAKLAEDRGVFPAWEGSVYNNPDQGPIRNSAPTTIAPTGTISIISGCSSGIEPLFALSYVRNVMDNTRLVEGNPFFEAVAKKEGFYSRQLMEEVSETGSLAHVQAEVPQWVKDVFVTSHDISPEWHVKMQAAFQRYTDNAVSKTINFPNSASVENIAGAYMLAYELGCKGITTYRDGSKENQVLSAGESDKSGESIPDAEASAPEPASLTLTPKARPQEMRGITERIRTGHGTMYITINFDEDKPFEVFTTLGKAGGCDSAQLEAISRLVSLALRSGIDMREIVEQLRGITCCPAWDNGTLVRSAPDAVALALAGHANSESRPEEMHEGSQLKLLPESKERPKWDLEGANPKSRCPDCTSLLIYQEGCLMCAGCGWNKCG